MYLKSIGIGVEKVLSRVSSLFLVQLWLGRTLVYSGIGIDIIFIQV